MNKTPEKQRAKKIKRNASTKTGASSNLALRVKEVRYFLT